MSHGRERDLYCLYKAELEDPYPAYPAMEPRAGLLSSRRAVDRGQLQVVCYDFARLLGIILLSVERIAFGLVSQRRLSCECPGHGDEATGLPMQGV